MNFLSLPSTGPDQDRADRAREKAEAYALIADFYELEETEQQLVAAAAEALKERQIEHSI